MQPTNGTHEQGHGLVFMSQCVACIVTAKLSFTF